MSDEKRETMLEEVGRNVDRQIAEVARRNGVTHGHALHAAMTAWVARELRECGLNADAFPLGDESVAGSRAAVRLSIQATEHLGRLAAVLHAMAETRRAADLLDRAHAREAGRSS